MRGSEFLAPTPLFLQRGEGAGNGVHDPSCLREEASMTSRKYGVPELPGWWTVGGVGRGVHLVRAWKCHTPSHVAHPAHVFHLHDPLSLSHFL